MVKKDVIAQARKALKTQNADLAMKILVKAAFNADDLAANSKLSDIERWLKGARLGHENARKVRGMIMDMKSRLSGLDTEALEHVMNAMRSMQKAEDILAEEQSIYYQAVLIMDPPWGKK